MPQRFISLLVHISHVMFLTRHSISLIFISISLRPFGPFKALRQDFHSVCKLRFWTAVGVTRSEKIPQMSPWLPFFSLNDTWDRRCVSTPNNQCRRCDGNSCTKGETEGIRRTGDQNVSTESWRFSVQSSDALLLQDEPQEHREGNQDWHDFMNTKRGKTAHLHALWVVCCFLFLKNCQ